MIRRIETPTNTTEKKYARKTNHQGKVILDRLCLFPETSKLAFSFVLIIASNMGDTFC
jgi:hypothetical protein